MEKLRKILCYLMIPVALLIGAESWIYCSYLGFSTLEIFLCSLENVVMAFIARPTISALFAFKGIQPEYTSFELLITRLYGAFVIIAPILTTSAVLTGFKTYIFDFINTVRPRFRKEMYVIGDGTMAKTVAIKYADQYNVRYLMPEGTPDQERLPLLKKKVNAYPVDYSNIEAVLRNEKIEQSDCLVLNFSEWFDSYKISTDVIKYMVQNVKREAYPVCSVDAPKLYQDVFEDVYEGLCRKLEKTESTLEISFADVSAWNAAQFFKNPDLTEQPGGKHHIILVGLGRYGQAILGELVMYMMDHGLWGTIEIFDRRLEQNVANLLYSTKLQDAQDIVHETEPVPYASLSGVLDTKAGPINTNYYQASIGELKFSNILTGIIAADDISEMLLCIDNIEANFECYRMMMSYVRKTDNIRLYFRAGQQLSESFEALELQSDKFRLLPNSIPDINP